MTDLGFKPPPPPEREDRPPRREVSVDEGMYCWWDGCQLVRSNSHCCCYCLVCLCGRIVRRALAVAEEVDAAVVEVRAVAEATVVGEAERARV